MPLKRNSGEIILQNFQGLTGAFKSNLKGLENDIH
jgi:hypothetical protein